MSLPHISYMHSVAWWPTFVVLAIATVVDVRVRRIPNWLVFPFFLAGILFSASGHGSTTIGQSLSGVAIAVAVAGVLCWLRGMGMGDLKLCAAIGAWIGPDQMIVALVATGIAGGVMALMWAAFHRSVAQSLQGAGEILLSWRNGIRPHPTLVLSNPTRLKMPYAPAIAIGTLFSFFGI